MGFEALGLFEPEPLTIKHDCSDFHCGKPMLDGWLLDTALRNQHANFTRTFVTCDQANVVKGYYALCAGMIQRKELARSQASHGMPAEIPIALLARFAVHQDLQGKGVGKALMSNALRTAAAASWQVAFRAVVVDALDDDAAEFYQRLGFRPTRVSALKLLMPMEDVLASIKAWQE